MKSMYDNKLCLYLLLAGLLCNVGAAEEPENIKFVEENCIVACLPGKGPGQYYHTQWLGKGFLLWPRCFAIDPTDGTFYIPEVDTRENIRLHKFDRYGNFITMLRLEDKAYNVFDMSVDTNGDIYLYIRRIVSRIHGNCISRFDDKGKLLNRFGPKGPLTKEDIEKEKKAKKGFMEFPPPEKYFGGESDIFIMPNDKVFAVQTCDHEKGTFDTFEFDGRSGRLLEHVKENHNLPEEIEQRRVSRLKKFEVLKKAFRAQKRRWGYTFSLIGPDGIFYYMSVKPERLEICRAFFR
jgi:hypothetical protein